MSNTKPEIGYTASFLTFIFKITEGPDGHDELNVLMALVEIVA